jgi:hypothetical protein
MKRFQRFRILEDLFTITCKNCGSKNARLLAEECDICGTCISVYCNDCTQKYDPHDFIEIEEIK